MWTRFLASSKMQLPRDFEVELKFKVYNHNDSKEKLLSMGAKLVRQHNFTDCYYDTTNYTLTLANYWLRKRNGQWQVKCPAMEAASKNELHKSWVYGELENEGQIIEAIGPVLGVGQTTSLENLLNNAGCSVFAKFKTEREVYHLDKAVIVLDQSDFGFQVGEIEVIVPQESLAPKAITQIEQLADKLGFERKKRVAGKLDAYLKKNNMDHYQQLVRARILSGDNPDT